MLGHDDEVQTLAPMNEERFWRLVEDINWKSTERRGVSDRAAYRRGKHLLITRLSCGEASTFEDIFNGFKGAMGEALEDYEKRTGHNCGVGDDSWSDLLSHIVGCGKEVYERELADPSLAYKRARNYRFKESFRHALPSKQDYAKKSGGVLRERAKKHLDEFQMLPQDLMPEALKTHYRAVLLFLGPVYNGNFVDAVRLYGDAVIVGMRHLRGWSRDHEGLAHDFYYGVDNLVHDIREIFLGV